MSTKENIVATLEKLVTELKQTQPGTKFTEYNIWKRLLQPSRTVLMRTSKLDCINSLIWRQLSNVPHQN